MHTLTWLSKVILKINDISGLAAIFAKNDFLHLIKAFDFCLKMRLSLHIISKCRNDVLWFNSRMRLHSVWALRTQRDLWLQK